VLDTATSDFEAAGGYTVEKRVSLVRVRVRVGVGVRVTVRARVRVSEAAGGYTVEKPRVLGPSTLTLT
jgi:hypothetical protein